MRAGSWDASRTAFDQAARWFVTVAAAGVGRWDQDALGEWTVRDLVGHTTRSLLTVESYLDRPASSVKVGTPVEYFRRALAAAGGEATGAQRGRDAGAALGTDIPDAVAQLAERVLARVAVAHEDDLLTLPIGGMRLGDYLPTRTFELTVHTCDLAVALELAFDVPGAAAAESLTLLGGLAAQAGLAGQLLRAATGRERLPVGFTVL